MDGLGGSPLDGELGPCEKSNEQLWEAMASDCLCPFPLPLAGLGPLDTTEMLSESHQDPRDPMAGHVRALLGVHSAEGQHDINTTSATLTGSLPSGLQRATMCFHLGRKTHFQPHVFNTRNPQPGQLIPASVHPFLPNGNDDI